LSASLDPPFGSNDVRLSLREWAVALPLIAAFVVFAPIAWKAIEPLRIEPNHRQPFSLGSDYWAYNRLWHAQRDQGTVPVIGDSVIWGHYVSKDETLSACLNRLAGRDIYANLGVDGIHPAAMAGLVRYYSGATSYGMVILHCNLLWMSSPRHDLTTEKEFAFNHPTLVPQFSPKIPCYRETYTRRLDVAVERLIPFHAWKSHLQIAYFGDRDIPSWTIEHPYSWPVAAVALKLPSPNEPPSPRPDARPWTDQGITRQPFEWVEFETSLQWRCFRETVELLRSRGNRVFVLLGPFNEHMLTDESRALYAARKQVVADWLKANGIPHLVPDPLPSALYADASHPLAEGYKLLAHQLFDNVAFTRFHRRP